MNPSEWLPVLLRPHWLWALLALPALLALWRARRRRYSVWRETVDPHLLPHLLEAGGTRRSRWGVGLAVAAYVLAVLALSGPSWREREQSLWQSRTPLVIALDLSSRTLAGDVPPSRLTQARAKLATLLREREGGQVALVAFAEDAYTVAPLTDDGRNVALFLDALSPDIMPGDGQRGDRAIDWAARLLRQSGFQSGQILMITDQSDQPERKAAARALAQGYTVSVLGLGSVSGAPFQRPDGSTVLARLHEDTLRPLAVAGGGAYARITGDDADLRALDVLSARSVQAATARGEKRLAREDQGYWLLPPLMLLALLAFRRRGTALAALALCLWLPLWTAPAQAQGLWQRKDQADYQRLQQGNQAYRQGDFQRAGALYAQDSGADGQYNLGNALARQGQYEEAIQAYDRALAAQPGMADALANKRAVEEAMKRQSSTGGDGQGKGGQGQQGKDQGKSQGQDQDKDQGKAKSGQQDGAPKSPQDDAGQPPKPPAPPAPGQPPPSGQGQRQEPPQAADPQAQREADAAQRERMQRELERQSGQSREPAQGQPQPPRDETPEQRERRLANQAWLQRVPDDPGGLLREKFKIEYERRRKRVLRGE